MLYLSYKCTYEESTISLSEFYSDYFTTLQKRCTSRTYIVISAVVTVISVIIIAISICVFHFRHDIKFHCAVYTHKRNKYQELVNCDTEYEFDAFVAHHEEDKYWVRHELLPNLETPTTDNSPKFRLCIHDRDFLPGTSIAGNIIESVAESKKIILVLTNKFVKSSWCEFEVNMARMKCFDEGRDLIVVIMLEPVDPKHMSKTLRALVRRVTYIRWPENPEEKAKFWDNLRKTIKAPEIAPLKCECGRYITRQQNGGVLVGS